MLTFQQIRQRLAGHPLARVGPGLITGAADDDPSGIATYSQAGAQFGLNMLWTMALSYPLMAAVQSMCARIGRVTGRGLAVNISQAFPAWVLYGAVGLLLIANTFNIAADVAAMGDVVALMIGGNRHLLTVALAMVSLLMQVFIPYHSYVKFLKWLTLSLLSYAAVLFTVHVPWREVALRTPGAAARVRWRDRDRGRGRVRNHDQSLPVLLAVFGGGRGSARQPPSARAHRGRRAGAARAASHPLGYLERDALFEPDGVLHHPGHVGHAPCRRRDRYSERHPGRTGPAPARRRLCVLSVCARHPRRRRGRRAGPGRLGRLRDGRGHGLAWRSGGRAQDARGFYGVIAASMLLGLGLGFTPINPIKALFYSAVINGVVAVPLIVLILLLASRRSVLGAYTASRSTLVLGWITAGLMAVAAAGMLIPQ